MGELARDFPISRPAISQHLRMLKHAQLVVDRPEGNRRLYELNPAGVDALRAYFDRFWDHALAAFKRAAEAPRRPGKPRGGSDDERRRRRPCRKSITVNASVEHAFEVFTDRLRQLVAAQSSHRQVADDSRRHRAAASAAAATAMQETAPNAIGARSSNGIRRTAS